MADERARWATAVRVLALAGVVLLFVAVVEARAIRGLRAEVAALRAEREEVKAGVAGRWARQSMEDFLGAARWLHEFHQEPTEGFGRPAGLCASGAPDFEAVGRWVLGEFLAARADGRSMAASLEAMKTAIRRSDAYREVRPELALPPRR